MVAGADVDSRARQQLGNELNQMAQAAPTSGNIQAYQQFVQSLQTAQGIIQGMAGQTLTNNGAPIVADDGLLKTFQSTGSQFKDSSLFGTPGGTSLGQSMTVVVRGLSPCSYCTDHLIDMADAAGLNQLTVVDGVTGAVRQWTRGTTSWNTIKPAQLPK